jgi:hypothetical protein
MEVRTVATVPTYPPPCVEEQCTVLEVHTSSNRAYLPAITRRAKPVPTERGRVTVQLCWGHCKG